MLYISNLRRLMIGVGLSSDPDYVQLCHEHVESNAERIEKALNSMSKMEKVCNFLVEYKDECFTNVSDESLEQTQDFQQIMHGLLSHFCECIDIESYGFGFALPENVKEMSDQELVIWYNDNVIYPDKVRLNCYYYRHYSFWKDIEMIFATVLGRKVKFGGEEI